MFKLSRREQFRRWLHSRPRVVSVLGRTLKPWKLYRIKATGQRCQVVAYSENFTVRVNVIGHDDPYLHALAGMLPLSVFGLRPDQLEQVN